MVARVDFYILNDERQQAFWMFCCRLLQKIYLQKHNVYVHCASSDTAKQLDNQLWLFNDISFVPHRLQDGPIVELSPMITIGFNNTTPEVNEILLNLGDNVPDFAGQFSRILEIITPQASAAGRERYRYYQQQQYQVHIHKLNNNEIGIIN